MHLPRACAGNIAPLLRAAIVKIKFSISEFLTIAVIALAAYGLATWGTEAMLLLRAWLPRNLPGKEAPAPAPALAPLARQIPLCRKQGPGFQACMFNAGYAVNEAWTKAHDADTEGAKGTLNPARAGELLNDPYRTGASPVYGVPYWAPRPPPK
jgi:hypothetical protein